MRNLIILAGVATLACAPAHAVTFTSAAGAPDPGPAAGQALVVTFDAPAAAGYSWTGGLNTQIGSNGNAAAPAGDATRYGFVSSANAPKHATLLTPDLASISFYWGSIDTYNFIDVLGAGGATLLSISGAMLPPANGHQGAGATNRRIFFDAGAGEVITGLKLKSTGVAFEFDNFAARAAVPEPTTWAMMIAGFGLTGATLRRRRRDTACAAIA